VDSASGTVYAGTDVGVFSSSTTVLPVVWTEVGPAASSGSGFLPSAPVTAIQIFKHGTTKDLRVSTYGRGIWEFSLPSTFATTTTLTSSLNPANFGVSVTFTATVTTTGANAPTGTVTFNDGTTALGTGTLNGSQVATFATSTLTVGTHSITAVYGGDTNNAGSTSAILSQVIVAPAFTLTNTGVTSQTVKAGVSGVGYGFTVAPAGGAATFTGPVTFACSGLDATTGCVFNPASIAQGAGSTPVTLTITTSGPNTGAAAKHERADNRLPWLPFTMPLAGVVMLGLTKRRASKYFAIVGLCLALGLAGLLVACGSSTPISVSAVTPNSVSLWPNNAGWPSSTQAFTATVSNNTGVNWSISPSTAGSIDASGNYTAPQVVAGLPPTVTVTATSKVDSTKSSNATVTLKVATVPQTFNVTMTATETPTTHTLPFTLVVQ
jgi:hypothetical protein